ncbi:MAG: pantoate--beta-alanine ligase [Anaerolineae bacterium]|nr:pantoate--beta-alanine ligase [Anaerolineae bacterium]
MQIVDTIAGLRAARQGLKGQVGVVLTMGALHMGHLTLVREARDENDAVLTTIFVNPTQFGANEDLSKYPRDLPRDLAMLEKTGVDLVFTPTSEMMYPKGFQTWVDVTEVSQGLEGQHRPGHFKGVGTVVAKLFNLTQPDIAYFGQKDAQQVSVIKRMAHDLNFPLEVAVCPTVRETDGLAMSSRNVYLLAEQRTAAGVLFRSLQAAVGIYAAGERNPERLRQAALRTLHDEPLAQAEYVSAADAATLEELNAISIDPILLSMAVRIGQVRLIDNVLLPLELNNRRDLTRVLGG